MVFNIFGEKIEDKLKTKEIQKIVKIRLVKRGKSTLTLIKHLALGEEELDAFSSEMKRRLGCGGSVKQGEIELQGDKVDQVLQWLKDKGIQAN